MVNCGLVAVKVEFYELTFYKSLFQIEISLIKYWNFSLKIATGDLWYPFNKMAQVNWMSIEFECSFAGAKVGGFERLTWLQQGTLTQHYQGNTMNEENLLLNDECLLNGPHIGSMAHSSPLKSWSHWETFQLKLTERPALHNSILLLLLPHTTKKKPETPRHTSNVNGKLKPPTPLLLQTLRFPDLSSSRSIWVNIGQFLVISFQFWSFLGQFWSFCPFVCVSWS